MNTLVIDTSFGSTVGITGHEPICEQDSRTHVEKLQHDIAQVCAEAKIQPHDIERIVVGIGPAPFTGLRAGIVAAKAIAYATGAQLLGQDSLSGQAAMMQAAYNGDPNLLNTAIFGNWNTPANAGTALHLTLSVNDARRKQLYYTLLANTNADTKDERIQLDMNIGTPSNIAAKVSAAVATIQQRHPDQPVAVDIVGHGASKYEQIWSEQPWHGITLDHSLLDTGAWGVKTFAALAEHDTEADANPRPIEPLYLRRPDVSVPNPLKHVLNHEVAHRNEANA